MGGSECVSECECVNEWEQVDGWSVFETKRELLFFVIALFHPK